MFKKIWNSLFISGPQTHEVGRIRVLRIKEKGMVIKIIGGGSCEEFKEGDYLNIKHSDGKDYVYRVIRCNPLNEVSWEAIVVHPNYPVKWD